MLKEGIDLPDGFSILPSFYEFVCKFGQREDIIIVFRTFGNDGAEVCIINF